MNSRTMVLLGPLLLALLLFTATTTALAQTPTPSQRQIKINEFMAANTSVLEDPQAPGKFPDWFELYNPTGADVSLDGLVIIGGDLASPSVFPISNGLSIPASGYVIFYADDDEEQGPFHTSFRLSKAGDRIGLYGDLGGTDEIDARAFGPQTTNYSEGREPDGGPVWRQYSRPTPGRTNGLEPPLIRDVQHAPALPTSGEAVQVTATISDDGSIVSASLVYSLTGVAPVTVPMATTDGTLYAGEIPAQPSGAIVHYYVTATDNEGQVSPDPAFASLHYYRYPVDYVKPTVVINELMADNYSVLEDPDDPGNFPDWFEIYNYGTTAQSLDGLFLTDNMGNPTKYAITETTTITPGAFVLFYADEQSVQGIYHTNFKLSKMGETLAIFGAEGSVEIDSVTYTNLITNWAYGRIPDGLMGEQKNLPCASPGVANIDCNQRAFMPVMLSR